MPLLHDQSISLATNDIFEKVTELMNTDSISPSSIIGIIAYVMTVVENYRSGKFPGKDKKTICFNVVKKILSSISGDNIIEKDYTLSVFNNVFDSAVETIIDITKNNSKHYGINTGSIKNTITSGKSLCSTIKNLCSKNKK